MYDDVITVFNKYESDAGDTWYPTVIKNVNVIVDSATLVEKYGEQNQNSASLHIKYEPGIIIGNKAYADRKAWQRLTNDLLSSAVTFGTNGDFFYIGEWENLDPIPDDDYVGGFYNMMNKYYDHVYAITSVGLYKAIPHFEILGK